MPQLVVLNIGETRKRFRFFIFTKMFVFPFLFCLGGCIYRWYNFNKENPFNNKSALASHRQHSILMMGSMFTANGYSIAIYRLFKRCDRVTLKVLHAAGQTVTICGAVLGLIEIKKYFEAYKGTIDHFCTTHATLGIVTVVMFLIQYVLGFIFYLLCFALLEERTANLRARSIPFHATFGRVIFALSIGCCLTGITQNEIQRVRPLFEKNWMYLIGTGCGLILTGLSLALYLGLDQFRYKTHLVDAV